MIYFLNFMFAIHNINQACPISILKFESEIDGERLYL